MEDDIASPYGFQLLNYQGMGEKPLGVRSNGNLDGGYPGMRLGSSKGWSRFSGTDGQAL